MEEVLTHYGDSGEPAEVFRQLAWAALGELRGDASREDALTLLAADAFVTYACEAMAESHPERLGEL